MRPKSDSDMHHMGRNRDQLAAPGYMRRGPSKSEAFNLPTTLIMRNQDSRKLKAAKFRTCSVGTGAYPRATCRYRVREELGDMPYCIGGSQYVEVTVVARYHEACCTMPWPPANRLMFQAQGQLVVYSGQYSNPGLQHPTT